MFTELSVDGGGTWFADISWPVRVTLEGAPPSIIVQPQSQSVGQGSNATFSVTALGGLPLSYQWRFNSTGIAGATSTNFTRSNVQSSDQGNYSVIISNAAGVTTSSNAVLTVVSSSRPQFSSLSLSGANLIIRGTGGPANGNYFVLASTNVKLPLAMWTSILTNQFNAGGDFVFTNAITPSVPKRFYTLQVP